MFQTFFTRGQQASRGSSRYKDVQRWKKHLKEFKLPLLLFFVDLSRRQIPDEKQFDLENIIAFYLKSRNCGLHRSHSNKNLQQICAYLKTK